MSEKPVNNTQVVKLVSLEKHMVFICPECGKELNTQLEWRYHLNIVHDYLLKNSEDFNYKIIDGKYYECQVCRKWLANAVSVPAILQYHRFMHLSYPQIYRCKHCAVSFRRKRDLGQHLLSFHSLYEEYLNDDKNVSNIEEPSYLETTHAVFSDFTDDDLDHIINDMFEEIHSEDDDEPEPIPPKVATLTGDKLQEELQKYIIYICPECGVGFNNQELWRTHIFKMHKLVKKINRTFRPLNSSKTTFMCLICQKIQRTSKVSNLRLHYYQHMPYISHLKCSICKITMADKQQMLQHLQFLHIDYISSNAV